MLVVGLVRQRGGDLLNIDHVQVEHPDSVRPGMRVVVRCTGGWLPHNRRRSDPMGSPGHQLRPMSPAARRAVGGIAFTRFP